MKMKINISLALDAIEVLNKVVNEWVTTTFYQRQKLAHFYISWLIKTFGPYHGIAYRVVYIDPEFLEKLKESCYTTRPKTPADLKELQDLANSTTITMESYEAHQLEYYWDEIKTRSLLKSNGSKLWWKGISKYITKLETGKYMSWSHSLQGCEEYVKIVDRANRNRPVQFEDFPTSEPFIIKAKITGLSLYNLAAGIKNKSKRDEVRATKEIIAILPKDYELIRQDVTEEWLPKTFYT